MITSHSTTPTIYVLGTPRILLDGKEIRIAQNRRSMVALYLATRDNASTPLNRENLMDIFEFNSRNAFKVNLSRLKTEEAWYGSMQAAGCKGIESTNQTISFSPSTDYHLYLSTIQQIGMAIYTPNLTNLMTEALHWLTGDFMEGFDLSGDKPAIQELAARRKQVHARLNDAVWKVLPLLDTNESATALYLLENLAKKDSTDENVIQALMERAAVAGEKQRALAAYEHHEHSLAALALTPSPKLQQFKKDIENNIFALTNAKSPTTGTVVQQLPQNNLPEMGDAFIERDAQLDNLGTFLRERCRLITIVGVGGIGKTRIAIEAGREHLRRFPDGIIFVSLASLQSKTEVWQRIAKAWGILLVPKLDPLLTVIAALRNKRCLLILDNAESAPEDFALQVETLLKGTESLRILVTSRRQLAQRQTSLLLEEEQQIHLSGMTPEEGRILFLQRADREDFETEEEDYFKQLHNAIGGMPLAIEVLAGMHHESTIQELCKLVEKSTLPLSEKGDNPRLKHIFQASFEKLSSELQEKYCQLSVFQHNFTSEMVEIVLGVSAIQLLQYQKRSLLSINRDGSYNLHPILHDFAKEELQLKPYAADAYTQHAHYFLKKLEQEHAQLSVPRIYIALADMKAALHWLEQAPISSSSSDEQVFQTTINNLIKYGEMAYHYELSTEAESLLRKALSQSKVSRTERALATFRLAQAIRGRDMQEAKLRYQEAWQLLDTSEDPSLLKAEILNHWGLLLSNLDLDEAQGKLEQSHRLYSDMLTTSPKEDSEKIQIGIGKNLRSLAQIAHKRHYSAQALMFLEESYDIFHELNNILEQAKTLTNMGGVYYKIEQNDDAEEKLKQAIALYEELRSEIYQRGTALALNNLGLVHKKRGEYELALKFFKVVTNICQQATDMNYMGLALTNSASVYLEKGDYTQAHQKLCQALDAIRLSGNPETQRNTLILCAEWALASGSAKQAYDIAYIIYLQENTEYDVQQRAKNILKQFDEPLPTNITTRTQSLENLVTTILKDCNAYVTP